MSEEAVCRDTLKYTRKEESLSSKMPGEDKGATLIEAATDDVPSSV